MGWLEAIEMEGEDDSEEGKLRSFFPNREIFMRVSLALDSFISESLELSLSLANRSACLHRARFYRRAAQDVELAIRCGYPR